MSAAVSVVIPVWNGEAHLGAALASVRAQTRPADQVIVVDDGSTDGSLAVARAVAAGWPAVEVLSQPNAGAGPARNAGVARATGDLLTFLDADDEMLPGRVAFQVAYLEEHPDADLVMGTEVMNVEEGVAAPATVTVHGGAPDPYILSLMVRREAFDRAGPFPADRDGEDIRWLYGARAAGVRIAIVDEPFLRRRIHGGNMTFAVTPAQMQATMLRAVQERIRARREGAG